MPDLAKLIGAPTTGPQLALRQATITAAPPADGTVTVRFGTGATAIAGVRRMQGAAVANGDVVWVLQNGYDLLVLGKVQSSTAATADKALLRVGNSYVGTHPVHQLADAANNWAAFGHWDRQGANDYGFMQNGSGRTLINASSGQNITYLIAGAEIGRMQLGATAGYLRVGLAQVGGGFYSGYAHFGHQDHVNNGGGYALLAGGDGHTYLNCHGGGNIWFRHLNNTVVSVEPNSSNKLNVFGTDRFGAGHCHRFWDDGEAWHWSIGVGGDNAYNAGIIVNNGWIRPIGDYGVYWEQYNTGWWCNNSQDLLTTYDHGIMRARRDTHQTGGGGWSTCGIRSEGTSGSGDKGITYHRDGHFAVAVYLGGDAITRYVGSDGAWTRQDGNWFNPSSRKIKRDIREFEPGGLKKIMQLKPKRFKYDPKPEDLALFEAQAKEGRWGDDETLGRTKKFRDKEYVGFIAEELAEVFPEAVGEDIDGNPSGYKDSVLAALMVQALQELTDRLETLEAAAAVQKKVVK